MIINKYQSTWDLLSMQDGDIKNMVKFQLEHNIAVINEDLYLRDITLLYKDNSKADINLLYNIYYATLSQNPYTNPIFGDYNEDYNEDY